MSKEITEEKNQPPDMPEDGPKKIVLSGLNDFGLLERVIEKEGDHFKYDIKTEEILIHDGKRYGANSHIGKKLIKGVIEKIHKEWIPEAFHVTPQGDEITKEEHKTFCKKNQSFSAVNRVMRNIGVHKTIQVTSENFDADIYSINTPKGLLNLIDKKLAPHSPQQLVTKIASASWNPEASCENWKQFIKEITCEDKDLAAFLQRWFGYCLSGSTGEEVLPIFHGNGANGKSIFLGRMGKLLGEGEYALTLGTDSLLNSKFHGIRCDLAQLKGARAAFAIEVNQGATLDEAVVKSITGGDFISARALRKNPIQFKPQAKIVMAVNHLPEFVGNDNGIRRRLLVVPFNAKFDGSVRKGVLEAKLDSELEGILCWAVEGFQDWHKQGLNPPEAVLKATKKYFEENDHINSYLKERTTQKDGAPPLSALYEDYKKWAKDMCHKAIGLHAFGELIQTRGFEKGRSKKTRFWKNIAIKPI